MFTNLLVLFVCFGLFTLAMGTTAYSTPKTLCIITNFRYISSCITAVCHLYTAAFYIWPPSSTENIHNSLVLYTYILFFSGAITCLPMALLSIYRGQKLVIVYIALLAMGISSICLGIFSLIVITPLVYKIFLVITSIYIIIHHIIVDGIMWWSVFSLETSSILDLGYCQDETI